MRRRPGRAGQRAAGLVRRSCALSVRVNAVWSPRSAENASTRGSNAWPPPPSARPRRSNLSSAPRANLSGCEPRSRCSSSSTRPSCASSAAAWSGSRSSRRTTGGRSREATAPPNPGGPRAAPGELLAHGRLRRMREPDPARLAGQRGARAMLGLRERAARPPARVRPHRRAEMSRRPGRNGRLGRSVAPMRREHRLLDAQHPVVGGLCANECVEPARRRGRGRGPRSRPEAQEGRTCPCELRRRPARNPRDRTRCNRQDLSQPNPPGDPRRQGRGQGESAGRVPYSTATGGGSCWPTLRATLTPRSWPATRNT